MTDEPTTSASAAVCPWCSAALPPGGAAKCPSCGAALINEVDDALPGLTTIDAGAIVRSRQSAIRPKSRLLSWLSGDDPDEAFTKAEGNALEPPELDVRREMFRMELEAEVANLQAENEAILAEAAAEGRVVEVPPELADTAESLVPDAMSGAITWSGDDAAPEAAATGTAEVEASTAATDVPAADDAPTAVAAPEADPAPDVAPADQTPPKSTKKRR
jgi:hypothetical protein